MNFLKNIFHEHNWSYFNVPSTLPWNNKRTCSKCNRKECLQDKFNRTLVPAYMSWCKIKT